MSDQPTARDEPTAEPPQAGAPRPAGTPEPDHEPVGEPPETGDPRVDEAIAGLAGISGRPPAEHVAVYEEVHRRLQDTLADLDDDR
jgi:hypothetical protein